MNNQTQECLELFIKRYPKLAHLNQAMIDAVAILCNVAHTNGTILTCGNGGSAADSEHFSGELLKSFILPRPIKPSLAQKIQNNCEVNDSNKLIDNLQCGVRCIPLNSFNSFNTGFNNDCNQEIAFAQLVQVFGSPKDVLIAFSTSGNSKNVIYAAIVAKAMRIPVISFTGEHGGELKQYSDILLNVPATRADLVQELHLPIYHTIALMTEVELFSYEKERDI